MTAATVKSITNILEGGDYYPVLPVKSKWHDENAGPIRAFAWPLLVQAGGLAQLSGSKLQLTKVGRNALSQPPGETLQRLWSKWIGTTLIDELSRVECVKGQTGKGKRGLTALSSRREEVFLVHWLNNQIDSQIMQWIDDGDIRVNRAVAGEDEPEF